MKMRADVRELLDNTTYDAETRFNWLTTWGSAASNSGKLTDFELTHEHLNQWDNDGGWLPEPHAGFMCEYTDSEDILCNKPAHWERGRGPALTFDLPAWLCHNHYTERVIRKEGEKMPTKMECWILTNSVLPYSRRTLLYGPPGTGKTRAGMQKLPKGVASNDVRSIYITEYTAVSEPRGNIFPVVEQGERVYKWFDGPATEAYRNGYRLVINEIDKASDDCITFFLNLMDDEEVSALTLPHDEVLRPHPNFTVVATMNGAPDNLIEAMRDRFPVTILIDTVNPDAVKSLSAHLQDAAKSTALADTARRKSIRTWKEFDRLSQQKGLPLEHALWACFGKSAPEMMATLKMGETVSAKTTRTADKVRAQRA